MDNHFYRNLVPNNVTPNRMEMQPVRPLMNYPFPLCFPDWPYMSRTALNENINLSQNLFENRGIALNQPPPFIPNIQFTQGAPWLQNLPIHPGSSTGHRLLPCISPQIPVMQSIQTVNSIPRYGIDLNAGANRPMRSPQKNYLRKQTNYQRMTNRKEVRVPSSSVGTCSRYYQPRPRQFPMIEAQDHSFNTRQIVKRFTRVFPLCKTFRPLLPHMITDGVIPTLNELVGPEGNNEYLARDICRGWLATVTRRTSDEEKDLQDFEQRIQIAMTLWDTKTNEDDPFETTMKRYFHLRDRFEVLPPHNEAIIQGDFNQGTYPGIFTTPFMSELIRRHKHRVRETHVMQDVVSENEQRGATPYPICGNNITTSASPCSSHQRGSLDPHSQFPRRPVVKPLEVIFEHDDPNESKNQEKKTRRADSAMRWRGTRPIIKTSHIVTRPDNSNIPPVNQLPSTSSSKQDTSSSST